MGSGCPVQVIILHFVMLLTTGEELIYE